MTCQINVVCVNFRLKSKKSDFVLPGGNKLAKMIQNDGFLVVGVKSTDLIHREKSTKDEPLCPSGYRVR